MVDMMKTISSPDATVVRELYFGGAWTAPSSSATIDVHSPSTEQYLGSVPEAQEADVDIAVAAARAAFEQRGGWSEWAPSQRADALDSLADELEKRKGEMARRVSAQNGMPVQVSAGLEGDFPIAVIRYIASQARLQETEQTHPHLLGGLTTVRREPLGVVAAIVPWNFPQVLSSFKYAPALAAGNTIVIKPSPETVLDSVLFAEAVDASTIPAGVVSVVPGGRELGAYLVAHPDVDKVAFTGSTAAGQQIAETCGRLLRPVTLELGGKSASIILDDADLNLAEIGQRLYTATLLNNGQTCFIGTRILAPRSRYDEIVELFAAFADSLPLGDALDETTLVGPLASARQRDRVEAFIAQGRAEGGKVVTGGKRPDRDTGWFLEPTVFAGLDNSAAVARQEIFGPVLTLIPYDGVDQAIAIANDSDYGLGGSVWTADEARGLDVARRVRTGTIGVNTYLPDPSSPFGGYKQSGIGRELGPDAIAAYQQQKSIYHLGV